MLVEPALTLQELILMHQELIITRQEEDQEDQEDQEHRTSQEHHILLHPQKEMGKVNC